MRLIHVLHIAGPFYVGSSEPWPYGTFSSLEELREALIADPAVAGFSDGQSPTHEYQVIDVTWRDKQGLTAPGQLAWRVHETISTPAAAPEEQPDG